MAKAIRPEINIRSPRPEAIERIFRKRDKKKQHTKLSDRTKL
ncbi:hypothetical protein KNP414_02399 [Paenibacillus mucilaginosus KNP414]|uniref:Uncharacterized protein n=1 Tax=Paenibacillus mucilaginosus (strain KNP414) TaxID=1036673 RepID=F8F5E9_PAEMK|nr:hypothetical protein KNP414_02399 [Paenibacillus mucilaginosus KNP414]